MPSDNETLYTKTRTPRPTRPVRATPPAGAVTGSGSFTEQLAIGVTTVLKHAIAPIQTRIVELERRVAQLEARPSAKYCGTWQPDATYQNGDMVTRSGSVWACQANHVRSTPGVDHTNWRLAVKRGRDGKDAR